MASNTNLLEVVVRQIQIETREVRSFVLVPREGKLLPEFDAGAHIDVHPAPGLVRQYSLVNNPGDRSCYIIGVKRETNGRGGSNVMHSLINEGDSLTISPPKSNFAMRENNGRSLFLAGGIGLTPLLSMAQVLARKHSNFEFHHFTRSDSEMAFRDLITNSGWVSKVNYHFGLVPPVLNDLLAEILRQPENDDIIYLCGPELFMDLVREVAESAGWPVGNIVLEHFSIDTTRLSPEGDEFVVRLDKRQLELIVPSDKTIIEVLREAGISVKTSCEQGICGTCIATIIEGEPDHRDVVLTDEDRDVKCLFTPCVSRSKSKLLVLDI